MEDSVVSAPPSIPPRAEKSKGRHSLVTALGRFSFSGTNDNEAVSPTSVLGKRKSWTEERDETETKTHDWALMPSPRAMKKRKPSDEVAPDAGPSKSFGSQSNIDPPRDSVVEPARHSQNSHSDKGKGKAQEVARFGSFGDSFQRVWSTDIIKRNRNATFPAFDSALEPFLDHANAIPEFRKELLGEALGLDYQLQGWEREVFRRHTLENEIRRWSKISEVQDLGDELRNSVASSGTSTSMARFASMASYTYEAPCYASIMRKAYDPEPRRRRRQTQSSGTQSFDDRMVKRSSRMRSEILAAEYQKLLEPLMDNYNLPRPKVVYIPSANGKDKASEVVMAEEVNNSETDPDNAEMVVAEESQNDGTSGLVEEHESLAGPSQPMEMDSIAETADQKQATDVPETNMQGQELERTSSLEVAPSDSAAQVCPQSKAFGWRMPHWIANFSKLSLLISDPGSSLPDQDNLDDGDAVELDRRGHRARFSNLMMQVKNRWKKWRRSILKSQPGRLIPEEPPRLWVSALLFERSELQESCEAMWNSLSDVDWVRFIHEKEHKENARLRGDMHDDHSDSPAFKSRNGSCSTCGQRGRWSWTFRTDLQRWKVEPDPCECQ